MFNLDYFPLYVAFISEWLWMRFCTVQLFTIRKSFIDLMYFTQFKHNELSRNDLLTVYVISFTISFCTNACGKSIFLGDFSSLLVDCWLSLKVVTHENYTSVSHTWHVILSSIPSERHYIVRAWHGCIDHETTHSLAVSTLNRLKNNKATTFYYETVCSHVSGNITWKSLSIDQSL